MNFVNDVHVQGLLEDDRHQIWITTLKNAICYQPATGAVLMNSLVSSSQNEWNRQYFDNSLCISPTGNLVFGSSDGCIFLPQEAGDQNLMANRKVIANKEKPDKKEAEDNKENLGNQKLSGNQHLEIYDQSKALEKGLRIYSLDIKTKDGEALAMNDDVHDGDSYTLAYDENDLSLSFFYPNYSRRSSLMFQYKLEGYDKNWREPSYDHTARFASLSPGRYTFRLRLVNSDWCAVRALARAVPAGAACGWCGCLKLIDQMLDFNQLETDALRLKVAKVDARKELLQLIASFEESTPERELYSGSPILSGFIFLILSISLGDDISDGDFSMMQSDESLDVIESYTSTPSIMMISFCYRELVISLKHIL